jgi:hypothetical protein
MQSRTVSLPVQAAVSFVGQLAAGAHTELGGPFVQFGGVPPVTGSVPQQTSPAQVAGLMHANPPPSSPPAS